MTIILLPFSVFKTSLYFCAIYRREKILLVENPFRKRKIGRKKCCARNAESSAPNNYRKIKYTRITWFGN